MKNIYINIDTIIFFFINIENINDKKEMIIIFFVLMYR